MVRLISLFVLLSFICSSLFAQIAVPCTTLGQTPSTAFPVCGTNTFNQDSVPPCGGTTIPVPPCPTFVVVNNIRYQISYTDINPYWYKFTCFKTGTLGFTLTPNNLSDDYDWQLFDITGHDPNEVYTNTALFFSCNWSGNTGITGANSSGQSLNNCGGTDYPTISAMPTVTAKHDYLLLVSHFTSTNQSGYKLAFDGGTASITDTTPPQLRAARAPCDGTIIYIKLNKKMKCGSIAADGSDFIINTKQSNIISASGVKCDGSFDTDSVLLVLNNPITPGKYTIHIKNGSDGNTILDICDNQIPPGDSLPVTIYPQFPTPMDTLSITQCKPTQLTLTFNKNIQCSTIATDGSDFIIKGNHPVPVDSAYGNCDENGFTQSITVRFKKPITLDGMDTIYLKKGIDGNTLINECGKESVVGNYLPFITYDTVSAAFTPVINFGCTIADITFSNAVNNHKNNWLWQFSDGATDTIPSFSRQLPITYLIDTVHLNVSNGICTDSTFQIVNLLFDTLKAIFEIPEFYCPNDNFIVQDQSSGKISSYLWEYSDGETSTLPNPPMRTFPVPGLEEKDYTLTLKVTNSIGCIDSASHITRVMQSCYIGVPSVFTPDSREGHRKLYPEGIFKAIDFTFVVYNRFGQQVFISHNFDNQWDGTINGNPQPSGTYVWMLSYRSSLDSPPIFKKGTTVLLR